MKRTPESYEQGRQTLLARTKHIRAVCVSGYGNQSARELANRLGISRNAVIGHWFRARKWGQLVRVEQ